MTPRRAAGLLLILIPVGFTVCFSLLQALFEYPDILRQPTADVLTKFRDGGAPLVAVWYGITVTAMLFVPLVVLVHHALAKSDESATLRVATTTGVIAGVVQTLGFLRWSFLVPHLAEAYLAPNASEAQRAAATLVFEAFHRYLGMGVGEHLGYLTTATWTFLMALRLARASGAPSWLGSLGMLLAVGIAAGLAEPVGLEAAGAINALSYLAWSLWLIVIGALLLVRRGTAPVAATALAVA
jgi:hypothetical protein